MQTWQIVIGIICSVVILIWFVVFLYRRLRYRKWRVGDKIRLRYQDDREIYTKNGYRFALLIAISWREVLLDCGDGGTVTRAFDISDIDYNHSLLWRKKYRRAKKAMKRSEYNRVHSYFVDKEKRARIEKMLDHKFTDNTVE